VANFTSYTRLFQLLCAPLLTFLDEAIWTHNSDAGYHKFSSRHHLLLSLVAHFVGAKSANALLDFLDDMNQTEVGTDSRIHELKVSDITGAGFVHPGTAEQLEALEPTTPGTDEAAEPKKASRSKKAQVNTDESSAQETQPDEPEQTQAQG